LVATDSRPRLPGVLLARLLALPLIGSLAARIARAPNRSPLVRKFLTPFHARLLRRSGGRLQRSWLLAAGQPVLSLTTTGRRTGQARSTVVTCFTDHDQLAVAGMNLGVARTPAWALNLEADPRAVIELRGPDDRRHRTARHSPRGHTPLAALG
jgi:deazaflavin-dependent oxidoreductase (nitroreductase family)